MTRIKHKVQLWLRKIRIPARLIAVYLIICLIPLLLVVEVYCREYEEDLAVKVGAHADTLLSMLNDAHSSELETMEHIAREISSSIAVQEILTKPEMSEVECNTFQRQINQLVIQNTIISPMVKNVVVVNADAQIAFSMGYDLLEQSEICELVSEIKTYLPQNYVTAIPEDIRDISGIILGYPIHKDGSYGKLIGYILLNLDEKEFANRTYADIYDPEQGQILLLSDTGIVISSESEDFAVGKMEESGMLDKLLECHKKGIHSFREFVNGREHLISFSYNSETRWFAISLIPDTYLMTEMRHATTHTLMMTGLVALIGLIALEIIACSIVAPIRKLMLFCQQPVEQRDIELLDDEGKDELGHLAREMKQMVLQIKHYTEREKQLAEERRNMELQMLQAQINPHFLFNTLNSLKWIAVMSRVPTLADGLSALANLLRNTIVNKDEFVQVEDELQNVKNYALIQSLRYGDKFQLEVNCDDRCRKLPVLKFILQPIVENSILHGVENVERIVTIQIEIHKVEDGMNVAVRDNGAGFDQSKGSWDNIVPQKKKLSGVGLSNVRDRLQLVYGKKAGILVQSQVGKGTCVTMTLPEISEVNNTNV